MKKFTFIAALVASIVTTAKAQTSSFYMDKGDSSKVAWTSPAGSAGSMEVHNDAINTASVDIKLNWTIMGSHFDAGWVFKGFCDNNYCRLPDEPGMLDGSKMFSSLTFAPHEEANFHILVNGDAAANKTYAYVTAYISNPANGDNFTTTFFASKDGTGAISVTRSDDNVTLYPNPAQNYIDVRYASSADVKTISIYNLIGKLVNVYKVSSNTSAHCEFNTDMPSGIYLVRIADSKGNIVATRKFTRQ